MTRSNSRGAGSNPFSTRFVRPGAIEYLFATGTNAAPLVDRLAECGWRGQIIGPHGSGKSTLVISLLEPIAKAGRRPFVVRLLEGQHRMPAGWIRDTQRASADLIVIDGYEQLSYWNRWRLQSRVRQLGWGLLATAHRDVGLPTLFCTESSLETAQAIVRRIMSGYSTGIAGEAVAACFAACKGDLRETLFALYDLYEAELPLRENPTVHRAEQNDSAA